MRVHGVRPKIIFRYASFIQISKIKKSNTGQTKKLFYRHLTEYVVELYTLLCVVFLKLVSYVKYIPYLIYFLQNLFNYFAECIFNVTCRMHSLTAELRTTRSAWQQTESPIFYFIRNQLNFKLLRVRENPVNFHCAAILGRTSVTRLGDLLDFGQLFKTFGNNYFAQISYILCQFL